MPLSIGPNTSLQQLQSYSKDNVNENQKIYSKTTTSCWSGNSTTKLHGSIFKGDDASFQTAKQDVIDVLTRHIGHEAALEITSNVFVPNTAMTGGQLKQVADRAIITQQMTALTQSINTGASDGGCVASRTCQRNGEFDNFLAGEPFIGLVSGLSDLAKSHDAAFVAQEIRSAANQLKTIDRAVAKEFLAALLKDKSLAKILNEQAEPAPSAFEDLLQETKGDDWGSPIPSKVPLHFQSVTGKPDGLVVDVGKRLGKGGMGGAVYLATDSVTGEQYALKHQPKSDYKIELGSMDEELHTPGSLGSMKVGKDVYMLMKLGEKVDFSKLTMGDLQNVFLDLDKGHNFSDNFVGQDIPEYGITHEDIHQGNMMMVDGKLSLIDWGKYGEFTQSTTERDPPAFTKGFIDGFRDNYAGDMKLSDKALDKVDMRQINCVTLTRQLILRILFQVGRDHDLKVPLVNAPGEFYKSVQDAMPTVMRDAPEAGGQVAVLLSLYEKQMSDIVNGNSFTAQDSARFLGHSPGRSRSNTVSFGKRV